MTDTFVSELFDPTAWTLAPGAADYTDITAHVSGDGRIARIAFDRPEVRNAFRPHTVDELYRALDVARQDPRIGVVLLNRKARRVTTPEGPRAEQDAR